MILSNNSNNKQCPASVHQRADMNQRNPCTNSRFEEVLVLSKRQSCTN